MAEVPSAETASIGPIRRARSSIAALETLDRIRQTPHTPPSPDDLAALRGWSGWGPLAPALDYARSGTWQQIGERISFLLSPEHYAEGMQATYNAFYTPPGLATTCWRILTDLGFTGGNVLEPGCGAGAFMACTPDNINVRWTGVERDPTTAAIAAALHPGASIQAKRFEEASLPSASMDAVIGNVPFGDVSVYDPTAPGPVTRSLHNYFIWRSVQALKPGGIAVLISSRYTLDALGEDAKTIRSAIAWDADLLGAIRMPNSALADGGTDVLADILVLRKLRPDEPRGENETPAWIKTGFTVGGLPINEYFLANPDMVLGELAEDRAPRYGRTLRVDIRPDDPPFETALAAASRAIIERGAEANRTWRVDSGVSPITAENAPFELRADGKKEGSFHLVDGVVHEVIDSKLAPVPRPGKELPKLIALRDATLALLDAEADHARPDAELEPLRAEANRRYDAYVKAHGYLNRFTVVEGKADEDGVALATRRRPSMGGFRRDPDFVTVLALEDFDDDTRTATKAALLERRVNRPRVRATRAGSAAEAVALCRDELGRIEPTRIAELLGVDVSDAERKLVEVAYLDPADDQWAPADEYLTGNVRAKLARAKQAADKNPDRYGRNVPALEAAQPADLEPEQIHAGLGASWIPTTDVREFAQELLGFDVRIWHEPRTSMWSVTTSQRAEESAAATSEWGTSRWNAYKLLEAGLNGKAPVVYDVIDDVRVRNQDETIAANDRLDALAARFSTWVWEDPDRADRLAAAYNENFNAVVPRRFDGSHLTFPGLDADFEPYEHQADMVARMISGSDALCPFPVGTGKTATMFMASAKLKALGLAQKPLIIVVPSTLEQIARDGKRLFPNARILMAGKEDLRDARARKLFGARCAMEDWDAVVMSHPSFTSLPVHATVQAEYVANLADEYRTALISAKSSDASSRKIKQIAKMVERLETESKNLLRHATDDGVFFEHLGVDYLLVDEMHYFKNLSVPVHTDGFSIQGSKRAQDLDMKLNWLRRQHPGLAVVTGFTGTPVSNTLLEAYILQHYLQPRRLKELGILSADAWAANFVRFATGVEISPDQSFRLNRRPAEIVNIPELMHTLGEVAELRPPESFPVSRPRVRRHNVAIEASDTVADYVTLLGERADAIHAGGVAPHEDNMLKICSDGRKVALHESLVGFPPDGPGKIGTLVDNVARIHHQTKDLELSGGHDPGVQGRLQLVFCDLGTPNRDKGTQVYGLIRRQLIEAGVPAERIRFIHDAATDAQRLALFDQCNKGEINVLLGSTDKLGVGVNVQRRAIALHHADAPWRPDQVEQRDGRVWRPKNLNPEVEIYRYVTEGSFDAFMWQALERKERALRPILSGQATARSIEDIGDVALDYGQIKAISTGNPLLAELNEVNVEVKRLASLAASFQRNQRRLRNDIQTFTMQAAHAANHAEALEAVAHIAGQAPTDSAWEDMRGNPLARDDEAAVLAKLAESTIAKGYCDGTMRWRGLDVSFAHNKHSGGDKLTARVTTSDDGRITVPLKTGWTASGQHWRIRDAITTAVNDAQATAMATREQIGVLKQRITENEAALELPFPEAEALDAARTRRTALDAAIREQADKDEEARRNRTPRPRIGLLSEASASPESEHRRLLIHLHGAMTAVVERVQAIQRPESPTAVPELEASHVAPDVPVPGSVPAPQLGVSDSRQLKNQAKDNDAEQPRAENAAQATEDPANYGSMPVQRSLPEQARDAEGVTPHREPQSAPPEPDADTLQEPPPSAAHKPTGRNAEPQQRSTLYEHALDLTLQGFAIFPLKPGTKIPLVKDWENAATTDIEQITQWWNRSPRANIGIACGPSNLLVVDLDASKEPTSTEHGQRTLIELADGRAVPETLTVSSARGGRHLYYRQPVGTALGNTVGRLGPLIDTRGHGGYIVGPGSRFNGGTYRVEREAAIAELPAWIVEELEQRSTPPAITDPGTSASTAPISDRRRTAYGAAALRRAASNVESAREGTRNHTLNREAFRLGRLVGGGIISRDQAATALDEAARKAGLPPDEIVRTIASGLAAGIKRPHSIPDRTPAPEKQPDTNAKENTMSTTTSAAKAQDAPPTKSPRTAETGTEPIDEEQAEHAVHKTAPPDSAQADVATTEPDAVPGEAPGTGNPAEAPDLDAIFADTQNRISAAREALPDVREFSDFDALQRSIDQLHDILTQMPSSDTGRGAGTNNADQQPDQGLPTSAADLDEHLAAMDAAYADAQSAGVPTDRPEWVGITAIHGAVRHLWDTIKAAPGSYWTELAADVRVRGLLTALAARAARAIASLADSAANRLDQRTSQPVAAALSEPTLREAYINARSQIRSHAATHEWQRITALWGTVNTLARKTDDPGIRAVVAHSANAMAEYADALARKVTQYGDPGNAPAVLTALSRAAERHATTLRLSATDQHPGSAPPSARAVEEPAPANPSPTPEGQQPDARAIQEAALRVAQRAQQRLGAPARPRGVNALRNPAKNHAHRIDPRQQTTVQQHIVPGALGGL